MITKTSHNIKYLEKKLIKLIKLNRKLNNEHLKLEWVVQASIPLTMTIFRYLIGTFIYTSGVKKGNPWIFLCKSKGGGTFQEYIK